MKVVEYRGVRRLMAAIVTEDSTENYTTGTPFEVAGVAEVSKTVDSSTSGTGISGRQATNEIVFASTSSVMWSICLFMKF